MNRQTDPRAGAGTTTIVSFFVSFLCGDAAVQIQSVAVAWSVYSIHHRAFDLGLVGLVMFAPSLLLVFVTGHVADRYDRKRTVILAAVGEGLISLVLAALVFAHVQHLGLVLGIVFILGVVRAFAAPLEPTILVSIVAPHDYLRVQARFSSLRELVVIVAPAIGGALIAFSLTLAFVIAAVMMAVTAATFAVARLPVRHIAAQDDAFTIDSALGGLRFVLSRPVLLGAMSLDLVAVLFGGATTLLPIYADGILHVGAFGFGLLRGASGLGAAVMALVLSRRPPARRVGRTLLVSVAAFGAAMIVFAFSRTLWLSIAALAAAGAFDMISVVVRRGLIQLNTPDAMRGRVNAISMVFIGASSDLGALESGTVAQFFGAVPSVAFGGIATLAVVGIWTFLFPDLRRSDEFVAAPSDLAHR